MNNVGINTEEHNIQVMNKMMIVLINKIVYLH
jgi:hypothetical protein